MNIIFETIYGSHLYGCSHENSDVDYKGIYLPTIEDLILQKVKPTTNKSTNKSSNKNTKDDVDIEYWTIQHFVKTLFKNEMQSMDVLHVPDDFYGIKKTSDIWKEIRKNRHRTYTKKFSGLVGYIFNQAKKYENKSERYESCIKILEFLETKDPNIKLSDIWDELPELKFVKKDTVEPNEQIKDFRIYTVCNRTLQPTIKIWYAKSVLKQYKDEYGKRVKEAKENKNIDFKAISHSFRACYQIIEILETGDLIFPLKQADFLLELKLGNYHYYEDGIDAKLKDLVDKTLKLLDNSTLPEKVDTDFWENLIIECYK